MIKLLVPTIPPLEAAMPYLNKSEAAKHYANFGPCVVALEERLSEHFSGAYIVTCSNCTTGLEMVYTLKMIQGYSNIELPALTFPATWLAANRSGLNIIPIDVDKDTWIAPGVAGFGVPSYAPVVDAAGAFGEQRVPLIKGGMTAVFSLHATKPLGCGEGGFIVTWDVNEAEQLRQMSNFGIKNGTSVFTGTNAKLSEFHAAMALAALDRFDRDAWVNLNDLYVKYLPKIVTQQQATRGVFIAASETAKELRCETYVAHIPPKPVAQLALERMFDRGIQCRRWYCPPLTEHPLFKDMRNREQRRKNPLPITDELGKRLLGLPFHLHLTESDVKQVCETLEESIETEDVK